MQCVTKLFQVILNKEHVLQIAHLLISAVESNKQEGEGKCFIIILSD